VPSYVYMVCVCVIDIAMTCHESNLIFHGHVMTASGRKVGFGNQKKEESESINV
jgi:hypothetical protein